MMQSDQVEVFGQTPSGEPVHRITLAGGDLTAKVLTFGANVQDLRIAGVDHPLVLGSETLEPYLCDMRYVGALVGRYANRIANGQFTIDGIDYQVSQNFLGKHCLHGGEQGSDQMVWTIETLMPNRVELSLVMPDGHMGFPGELRVQAEISLTDDNALQFKISATTTKATPCCFAHHGYFNLDGSKDITDHRLQVFSEKYIPVGDEKIPTGEIDDVAGSHLDFRKPDRIGQRGVDHNFCLSQGDHTLSLAAELFDLQERLKMSVETTETGLQVCDAAHASYAGLALETQAWPNAPNHSQFPNAILHPGETYRSQTRYHFEQLS